MEPGGPGTTNGPDDAPARKPRRGGAADQAVKAARKEAKAKAKTTRWTGSDYWQSSAEFNGYLRQRFPYLRVDERAATMVEGPPGWKGEWFRDPPATPRQCRFCRGRIRKDSDMSCPLCGDSGHRARLAAQRKIAGTPTGARVSYPSRETVAKVKAVAAQVKAKAARWSGPGG